LDLFKAGWIKLMVIQHDFPKPTGKAADTFLETIPDLPTQALEEAGVAIRPRLTALEIMEELLSSDVPWFDDTGLHSLLAEQARDKQAAETIKQRLKALARVVDQQWSEHFSWRQQASRALATSKQLLVMGAKEAKTKATAAASKAVDMAGNATNKAKAKTSSLMAKTSVLAQQAKNQGKAQLQSAHAQVRASLTSEANELNDEPTEEQTKSVIMTRED
jgi:hypothetical protein